MVDANWSHFKCVSQVHLLIDQINAAIVDFNKAVTLQPNFPVAYVQKLYTDYRWGFHFFWSRSLTVFGMQSCKHYRGHGDCQQGFGSVQRGGGKVPQVGRNNCFQFVVCQQMILSHHKLATNDLFSMSGVWKPMPSMLRCWMTSRYSFIYDLCQEKIIQAELYESCVQEFDRADALYQQGMKVDPGNANLLVGHLE